MNQDDFNRLWDALIEPVRALEQRVNDMSRLTARAEVAGALEVVSALPTAGQAGRVLYNAGQMYLDNGSTWSAQGAALSIVCQGRLTLASGVPMATSDITAATTLYFTPYQGNRISLWDGSQWALYSFTERSISLASLFANRNLDVFAYASGSNVALNLVHWTDDATRAVALALRDGVLVRSDNNVFRYLGTIRTTAAAQGEDSVARRFVWNMYNRVPRYLYNASAVSHTYNVAAWRAWNNDATLRVEFVIGETSAIRGDITGQLRNTVDGYAAAIGLGLNSAITALAQFGYAYNCNVQFLGTGTGGYVALAAGFHFLQGVEYGNATNAAAFAHLFVKGMVFG